MIQRKPNAAAPDNTASTFNYITEASIWKDTNAEKTEASTLAVGVRSKDNKKEVYVKISTMTKTGTEWKSTGMTIPLSKWNVLKLAKFIEIADVVADPTDDDDCIIKLISPQTKSGVVLHSYVESEKAGEKLYIVKLTQFELGNPTDEKAIVLDNQMTVFHEKINTDAEEFITLLKHALGIAQFRDSNSGSSDKAAIDKRNNLLNKSRRGTPSVDGNAEGAAAEAPAPRAGINRRKPVDEAPNAAPEAPVETGNSAVNNFAEESAEGEYL